MRAAAAQALPDKNAPAGRRGGGGAAPAAPAAPAAAAAGAMAAGAAAGGGRAEGAAAGGACGGGRGGLSVGEDSVDWPAVFAAAKIGGMKNFFIEQTWD